MCNYCGGENQIRSTLLHDSNNNPLCVWYEGGKERLLLDDGETKLTTINFCPMCGRKLN